MSVIFHSLLLNERGFVALFASISMIFSYSSIDCLRCFVINGRGSILLISLIQLIIYGAVTSSTTAIKIEGNTLSDKIDGFMVYYNALRLKPVCKLICLDSSISSSIVVNGTPTPEDLKEFEKYLNEIFIHIDSSNRLFLYCHDPNMAPCIKASIRNLETSSVIIFIIRVVGLVSLVVGPMLILLYYKFRKKFVRSGSSNMTTVSE